ARSVMSSGSSRYQRGRFACKVALADASLSMHPTVLKPADSRPRSSPPAPVNAESTFGSGVLNRPFLDVGLLCVQVFFIIGLSLSEVERSITYLFRRSTNTVRTGRSTPAIRRDFLAL